MNYFLIQLQEEKVYCETVRLLAFLHSLLGSKTPSLSCINHFQVDICVSIFVCEILLYSVFIVLFVFLFPFLVCYQDLPIDEETRHLVLLPCVYELPSGPAAPTCSVSTSYKPTHMYSIDSFPSYNLLKFFLKEKIKMKSAIGIYRKY